MPRCSSASTTTVSERAWAHARCLASPERGETAGQRIFSLPFSCVSAVLVCLVQRRRMPALSGVGAPPAQEEMEASTSRLAQRGLVARVEAALGGPPTIDMLLNNAGVLAVGASPDRNGLPSSPEALKLKWLSACRRGSYATVQSGIREGWAPVNACDAVGYTALMRCCVSGQARHPTPCRPTLRHPTPRLPGPVLRPVLRPFPSPA